MVTNYNANSPADTEFIANGPADIRVNQEALRNDAIVNAGTVNGLTTGNNSGNIPVSNGVVNTNLNADKLDGNDASAFATSLHTHSVATGSSNGFMSNTDKTKLDNIAAGAQVNQNAFANVLVSGTTIQATAQSSNVEIVPGTNIAISPDNTNKRVTISVSGKVATAASADTATTASSVAWSGIANPPTTIAGYGITDAYTKTASDARYAPSGYGIGGYVTTLTSIGINTVVVGGRYYCASCTDIPAGVANGFLDVVTLSTTILLQRYTSFYCATYERFNQSGTWSAWKQIATIDQVVLQDRTVKLGANATISAGASGSDYPILGYGVDCTSTINVYTGNGNVGAFIKFGVYSSPLDFYKTSPVTAGTQASPVRLGYFDTNGNLFVAGGTKQVATTDQLDPGHSFATNGWQKLSSGMILQWGTFTFDGTWQTISFPISFPSACLGVIPAMRTPNDSWTDYAAQTPVTLRSYTTASFVAAAYTGTGWRATWSAIGY